MPSGRTHFMAGAVGTGYALYLVHGPAPYILVGAIAALLPDTDIKHSVAGKLIPLWLFCKHRGFTHSLLALGIVSVLASMWGAWAAYSVCVGYFSHLVLDSLTPMRIPWLWPRKQKRRRRR